MRQQNRTTESVQQGRIGAGVVVRAPVTGTVDPLKIVDGIPKKGIVRFKREGTPSIVPQHDPDGLPGHGRYGESY